VGVRILGIGGYWFAASRDVGGTMTAESIQSKRFADSKWIETKQDFLLVSSFGLWATLLGFSPVLAVRFLVGS
jgi:hypothetical protein